MWGKLATAIGYAKQPKATFILKHPVEGTKALVVATGVKELVTSRAAMAVGAVAAAVPVAAVLIRRRTRNQKG